MLPELRLNEYENSKEGKRSVLYLCVLVFCFLHSKYQFHSFYANLLSKRLHFNIQKIGIFNGNHLGIRFTLLDSCNVFFRVFFVRKAGMDCWCCCFHFFHCYFHLLLILRFHFSFVHLWNRYSVCLFKLFESFICYSIELCSNFWSVFLFIFFPNFISGFLNISNKKAIAIEIGNN